MIYKHKWKFILSALLLLIVLSTLIPSNKNIQLGNGGHAHITKASFLRSLGNEAHSTISYQTKDGKIGKIILWQDIFDGPTLLFSASDTNVLLCLYDYDVDFRLFKISIGEAFKPLSLKSDLNQILFSCTWKIEDGTDADWMETLSYLHKVSFADFKQQSVSVGFRHFESPNSILKSLAYQGRK